MPADKRDVLITGIGLVSCLGEGLEAHWNGLTAAKPVIDETSFSPYVVHPLAPVNFDLQIPKKGDQRQNSVWTCPQTPASILPPSMRACSSWQRRSPTTSPSACR